MADKAIPFTQRHQAGEASPAGVPAPRVAGVPTPVADGALTVPGPRTLAEPVARVAQQPSTSGQPLHPRVEDYDARRRLRLAHRRRWTAASFALFVLLPTIVAGLYYAFVASDRYAVEVRYAVRGSSGQIPSTELSSFFTGATGSSSTITDSYMLMDFVESRDMVDKLERFVPVRDIYARSQVDWYQRLDPTITIENLLEYWQDQIDVEFDSASQIITLEVTAFTAQDALHVAQGVLKLSEDLINEVSLRARNDAVKLSQAEVNRIEELLRKNRRLVQEFRVKRRELDPVKKAAARLELIAKLETELTAANAKIGQLRQYMSATAPPVVFLRNQASSLEVEINAVRAKTGENEDNLSGENLSELLAKFDELEVERSFIEKAYESSLTSLEAARVDAIRQQRYLTPFVIPSLPEEAIYPERDINTFIVFCAALMAWIVGLLMFHAVRDHAT